MRARGRGIRGRRASTIGGMVRRGVSVTFLLCVAAWLAAGCQRPVSRTGVSAHATADFHHSDPAILGATGRPQLLEFFGPT